jgi:hypothetical protein
VELAEDHVHVELEEEEFLPLDFPHQKVKRKIISNFKT